MPIFSNRTLASMIGELPSDVRAVCSRDLVGRLRREGPAALAAEWELFVLRQMSVYGKFTLVPKQKGVDNPDAIFHATTGERLVVEVTALTDQEIEERFPINRLASLFHRKLSKSCGGRLVGSFDVVSNHTVNDDGMPNLAVPHLKDLHKFMASNDVNAFIASIAESPHEPKTFVYGVGNSTTTVLYKPGAQFSTTTPAAYAARRFNPYNQARLERKISRKVSQMNASGLGLPGVLVLCDADCSMLRDRSRPNWDKAGGFTAISEYIQGRPEVRWGGPWIRKGIRQKTSSLNAVLVLSAEERRSYLGSDVRRQIIGDLFRNEAATKYALSREAISEFLQCFAQTPRVQRMPTNAKTRHPWPDNTGGGQLQGNRVRLPLLAFQDVLTGKLSMADFATRHKFLADHMRRMVGAGKCISSTTILPSDSDHDDDWIELDFSGIDPRDLANLVDAGL